MLKELNTTNFRKLTNNTITYTPGLNAIRAPNEGGKTTSLEAWAYLFFGVKACRNSLEEVVTWGQKVGTLKVEGRFEVAGVEYYAKRSKSGAEINYVDAAGAEQNVTGQSECTAFIERLIGVTSKNVSRLLFASQNEIRGALEEGAPATMALIEKLADFEQIDNVLTLIQANLVTGNTATAESNVARATEQIEALGPVVAPDLKADLARLQEFTDAATAAGDAIAKHEEALEIARAGFTMVKTAADTATRLSQQQNKLMKKIEDDREAAAAARAVAGTAPLQEEIDGVREQIAFAAESERQLKVHRRFLDLVTGYPEAFWDEGREALAAEITKTRNEITALDGQSNNAASNIRVAQATLIKETACGLCGKDLSAVPEVVEKNAKQEKIIADARALIAANSAKIDELRSDLKDLLAVQEAGTVYTNFADSNEALIEADHQFVPARLKWKLESIPAVVDVASLRAKLTKLETATRVAAASAGRVQELERSIAAATAELDSVSAAMLTANAQAAGLEDAQRALQTALDAVNDARGAHQRAQQAFFAAKGDIDVKRLSYETAKATRARLDSDLKEAKEQLAQLAFNNALLKRVRQARPIIADKLWGIVLTAVSLYFSTMRGAQSSVTKDSDGFKVDGHAVESLSGSTLDILGLAIRLALTRTFLPNAPFMILDEPSSGCDDDRTAAMTGFLVSAGFPQILLVTHKSMDEAAAANLVLI
jgi:DNA repair exonuclease SbcCD ATPase subunit